MATLAPELEELRRIDGVWLDIVATTRTDDDQLAWTIRAKYHERNVQYTFVDIDLALGAVRGWLAAQGATTTTKKLRIKRSTS